ncbi:hypothetical protein BDQ17DRAFT_1251557 [Cyathus striatus]|nr:hypothetical protein BDQ17DRAFT_1251557 [Cyathus striatus]
MSNLASHTFSGSEIDEPEGGITRGRSIKDPIHDYIPLSPLMSKFIDTKQFQRLRDVKQLGTSCYVWPGASHNRFEHSIGVAYLSRLMASHLKQAQPELGITDRDISCVEIAGLCHDLGHGPWSHVWDSMFIPIVLPGSQWTHEQGSEMMLDYLITANSISIAEDDVKFIKALIAGDRSKCNPDEKPFLFDIVANKRNGLDVDKFDYIQRDSHMIGDPIHISLQRIINSARVLDNQICYDIKDANQIYEICATRFKLHKIIYNHKAAKAIEYMIIDGLLKADPYLNIARKVEHPEEYVHLTDNIMPFIEANNHPELAESRAIFERIRMRDLYRCVDYKVIDWPYRDYCKQNITAKRIVEEANKLPVTPPVDGDDVEPLTEEDVIVDFSTMHYGMKEKNPLEFVSFYSKRNPNKCAKANRGDYSNLMPQLFAEVLVRIYTKKAQYFGIVQSGYREVLRQLDSEPPLLDLNDAIISTGTGAITPPVTEAPSTPKAHSRHPSFSNLSFSTGTPFTNNEFTTVPPGFAPKSPLRGVGKKASAGSMKLKRAREEGVEPLSVKKARK